MLASLNVFGSTYRSEVLSPMVEDSRSLPAQCAMRTHTRPAFLSCVETNGVQWKLQPTTPTKSFQDLVNVGSKFMMVVLLTLAVGGTALTLRGQPIK